MHLAREICDECNERLICSWHGGTKWLCPACESASEYPELSNDDVDVMFEEETHG